MTDQREEQPASAESANEEIEESNLPLIDLETDGQRPPSQRKRAVQLGLALVAAVVVLVTFWEVAFPPQPAPPMPPTPKPLVNPLVLITSNVNYGFLTINGQRQQVKLPFLFQARNIAYTVTLEPVPLRAHTCHFRFTASGLNATESDGCFIGEASYQLPNGTPAPEGRSFAMDLPFTADDLPPGHVDQIITMLSEQSSVTQTIDVPAGSYYATSITLDGVVSSQRASTTLQGTAIRAPDFDPAPPSCDQRICPTSLEWNTLNQLTGQVWAIGMPEALRWQFAAPSGAIISDVRYPTAETSQVFLTYDAISGGWRVQPEAVTPTLTPLDQVGNLDCATGTMLAQQLIQYHFPQFMFSLENSYHRQLNGCEIVVRDSSGTEHDKLIWRFGVLLAADDTNQQMLPTLPLASPEEIAAIEG